MKDYVLIACPGMTDPVRDMYDGPILHIVRHYRPKRVVLILSEDAGKRFDAVKKGIEWIAPECKVSIGGKPVKNAFSFDALTNLLPAVCAYVRQQYPESKILMNISSGTPQMQTSLCMIALSDLETYVPVQVGIPDRESGRKKRFDPETDDIRSWLDDNLDNLPDAVSRCSEPQLLNFRQPMLQFQLLSLVENYDYSGARRLYESNQAIFSEETGLLIQHAERRLNLDYTEARKLAAKLGKELYPVKRSDILQLTEYFNSMKVKQQRGELNDFILRLEVLATYFGCCLLEKCLKIRRAEIADQCGNGDKYVLSYKKCQTKFGPDFPCLENYLNEQFSETRLSKFRWGDPLNALTITHICRFFCSINDQFQKYQGCTDEMLHWAELSYLVRNRAAHTITAITERDIQDVYGGTSKSLCDAVKRVFCQTLASEEKKGAMAETFDIYERINDMIRQSTTA